MSMTWSMDCTRCDFEQHGIFSAAQHVYDLPDGGQIPLPWWHSWCAGCAKCTGCLHPGCGGVLHSTIGAMRIRLAHKVLHDTPSGLLIHECSASTS